MKELLKRVREKNLPKKTVVMIIGAVVILAGIFFLTSGKKKTGEKQ